MSWPSKTIGSVVDAGYASIQTGPFGTQLRASDYVESGTPVINVRNIGYGDLRAEKLEFVSGETLDRLNTHVLEVDDIVFGRKGAVDRHLLVSEGQSGWVQGSDCIRLRLADDRLIPRFVSYALLSETHKKWMFAQAGNKATMASLNHDVVRRIRISVPPLRSQERIVDVLSAYDDLIDNNRRRIALLEQSARLLYREWFVHLRYPGHEHVKVVDGVPEGWGLKPVSEIADINARSLQRGFHGEIEYIDIASVTTGSINETTSYLFSEAPGRARRIVRHGDLIWSCVRPNRASYAMIWNPAENLVVSTGFCVLSPSAVPPAFLYFGLSTQDFIGYLTNNAKGAAYPAVVAKDFETYQLLVPGVDLLNDFQAYAAPIFEQMGVLKEQNSKLRQARDLLLPRLMRGEITLMECLEET